MNLGAGNPFYMENKKEDNSMRALAPDSSYTGTVTADDGARSSVAHELVAVAGEVHEMSPVPRARTDAETGQNAKAQVSQLAAAISSRPQQESKISLGLVREI